LKKKGSTPKEKTVIGATVTVQFPELGWKEVPARVDTGAATSSIHCAQVNLIEQDGRKQLSISLDVRKGAPQQAFLISDFKERLVKNSFGYQEKRYIIKTLVVVAGRRIRTEFSLADRCRMNYPVLLGRRLLKGRFLVDVSH
jgi:hypothetical protein